MSRDVSRYKLKLVVVAGALTGAAGTQASASVMQLVRVTPPEAVSTVAYEDVISSLEAEGYTIVSIETTMLGRIRILASNGKFYREVIISSSTGEVKRDVITGRVEGEGDGAGASGTHGLALGHVKKDDKATGKTEDKDKDKDKDEDEDEDDDEDDDDDDEDDDDEDDDDGGGGHGGGKDK